MPDFSELFEKANWQPILYHGNTIIRMDKFPIKNGEILNATIESAKTECRQGFCIDIIGSCEMDGKLFKKGKKVGMVFWQDTAPAQIQLKVLSKNDFVWIYNVWEATDHQGTKSLDYGHFGAAMIVEEIENGRRYRCNDWHPDDNFDDLIFTVQKLP